MKRRSHCMTFPVATIGSQQMNKRAFGSFHSSNVQELIALSEKDYVTPRIPIDVPSFTEYQNGKIKFGKAMKRKHFLLEKDWTFLNHGAFGAVIKQVLQASQSWQRYIDSQPVRFCDREMLPHLVDIIRKMAQFVGCDATDVVLVPNVTMAVNCVLRSLPLGPGDELMYYNMEYGANKKAIEQICADKGVSIYEQDISFPIRNNAQVIASLKAGLHKNTRLVVLNHIPSNTPFILPIKQMVNICHSRGIQVLVDGAHALGQLDLDISSLGADFYTTNCHKWFSACKGTALLYVSKQHQDTIRPLVISHGYDSGFTSQFSWTGLRDYSSFLSLYTALDFWQSLGSARIREYCYKLAVEAGEMLTECWNTQLLAPADMTGTLLCVQLPRPLYAEHSTVDYEHAEALQNILYHQHKIEVPIKVIDNALYVRISVHIYNTIDDYRHLSKTVQDLAER